MRSCSQKTCSPTFLVRRGRLRKCRPGFFLRSCWRWTRSLHAKLSRSSTGLWLCRWGRLDCFLLVGSQLAASPSWVVGKLSHQGDVLLHHCDSSSVSRTFLTVLKKINDARFCPTLKASQSIFSHTQGRAIAQSLPPKLIMWIINVITASPRSTAQVGKS